MHHCFYMALSSTSNNMLFIKQYAIQLYMTELFFSHSFIYSLDIVMIIMKINKMNDSFFLMEQAVDNSFLLCLHAVLFYFSGHSGFLDHNYRLIFQNRRKYQGEEQKLLLTS